MRVWPDGNMGGLEMNDVYSREDSEEIRQLIAARDKASPPGPKVVTDKQFHDLRASGFSTTRFISYSDFVLAERKRCRDDAVKRMEERKNGPTRHQGTLEPDRETPNQNLPGTRRA